MEEDIPPKKRSRTDGWQASDQQASTKWSVCLHLAFHRPQLPDKHVQCDAEAVHGSIPQTMTA